MKKILSVFLCIHLCLIFAFAQTVPAPKDVLGFTPGDDRKLASWAQIVDYFKKLDSASDRVMFEEIGKTTMGAPFVYATISTPANLKNLEKYKQINAKLADPRLIKSNQKLADELIKQGKTIVLITCGIHSTEVGSTLSSMLIAEKLAKAEDAETKKILENTIILLVPSLNPDGVDIVKNWYDKTLGTPYEGTNPPELYHKYVGHDNNRDWYAFTQVETQLTVDKIHNVWHPQIVHDIHQQGANGARLFLPPYMQPVEPNVPKEIVEGYTELGNFMANDLRSKGLQGITTNTTYDAWTPARAYSHYHGGVRILSETASAKLATPIDIKFENLGKSVGGLDAKVESPNFSPVWKGGEWKLRDITNYMTVAAFSLLKHSSDNREKWLSRFYSIGKEAVRPRKLKEVKYLILQRNGDELNFMRYLWKLERAGVEITKAQHFTYQKKRYSNKKGFIFELSDFALIKSNQPYFNFAKALSENQEYPDLLNEKGEPIAPYDVTAHSLALLSDINVYESFENIIYSPIREEAGGGGGWCCPENSKRKIALYRSYIPSMDEGWTKFIFDNHLYRHTKFNVLSLSNSEISLDKLSYQTIIFPDQSPNQILNGYAKGSMPDEYTGGIGKEGVENLRKFVEAGGTLVFLNESSRFAIEQFNLPVKDVTKGLPRKDFYIPGSILRTELDTTHPIAENMSKESIAWFEDSPAFEVSNLTNAKIIARYPQKTEEILLSGWALGAEKLAGKAALVEFTIGKGKIILFGFRPQYRGQSLATFPLLFNAISN